MRARQFKATSSGREGMRARGIDGDGGGRLEFCGSVVDMAVEK